MRFNPLKCKLTGWWEAGIYTQAKEGQRSTGHRGGLMQTDPSMSLLAGRGPVHLKLDFYKPKIFIKREKEFSF